MTQHQNRKRRCGLYADSGCAQERRAPRRTVNDCPDPASIWDPAGAGASDIVADVRAGALGEIAGADFFTTEVWTWRGLVTFYTVFVIELATRRVEILGSTPHPDEAFSANAQAHRRQVVSRADLRPGREVE